MPASPRISICIPHWQVRDMMSICLRSIRKHSRKYDLEVIVVDNGSRDDSLDYLRSLPWIRLIERPSESVTNWPANVFTAWDAGIRACTGELFVTMHSDVFVRQDGWLDPFLREMAVSPCVAATGAWKLALENPWYALQKRIVGSLVAQAKRLAGRRTRSSFREGHYPRDYCAMYRTQTILEHGLTFCPQDGQITGGFAIARQLWDKGCETRMIPVSEIARKIVHVAHGTAAVSSDKPLHHRAAQRKAERRAQALLNEAWVDDLRHNRHLDAV
ncbi:MAG: glycosyltransferase family 2 protein [Planctomycetia bacterium]|nr:glycosyltransferase family 2 protein [Planctomycetia bacterium]